MYPSPHRSDRKGHDALWCLLSTPCCSVIRRDGSSGFQNELAPLVAWAHPCTPWLAHSQLLCVLTEFWWVQIISVTPKLQLPPVCHCLSSTQPVLPMAGVAPLLCQGLTIPLTALVPPNSAFPCTGVFVPMLRSGIFTRTLLPGAALLSCGFISAPWLHRASTSGEECRASPGLLPREHFTPKRGSVRWGRRSSL